MQHSHPKLNSKAGAGMDITQQLEQFRTHIQTKYSLTLIGQLFANGEFNNIGTHQEKTSNKPFGYIVHLDRPQNIYYVDHKRQFKGTWYPKQGADAAMASYSQVDYGTRQQRQQAERLKQQEKAAHTARTLWQKAITAPNNHPYLLRKGIAAYGIKMLPYWHKHLPSTTQPDQYEKHIIRNVLLVPLKTVDGQIWNLQAIFPEIDPQLGRDKDFLPKARKQGYCFWIGQTTETVCIAEGYATAASLHAATGYRVIVAFDAGNLLHVAPVIRQQLPEARIVICADHDLPGHNGQSIGITSALKAAALVNGTIATPPTPGSDFNDWANEIRSNQHGR